VSAAAQGLTVVMFTDLIGSTALLARLGDDRMQRVQAAHVADVKRVVLGHGGTVHKSMGDGVMASFPSALSALAAAAAVPRDMVALDAREGGLGLAVRVGVSAGEPIADADGDLHGMAVVVAARLCGVAAENEILVQDIVRALVASRDGFAFGPVVGHELKGVPGTVPAGGLDWRSVPAVEPALDVEPPASAHAEVPLPRLLAVYASEPYVGRHREAAVLREALHGPESGRRAALVLGEPGIGKTRHAAASAQDAHADGVLVVAARCPPETATAYQPWVQAIGELARADGEGWRARLAAAAGGDLCALVPELAGAAGSATPGATDGAQYRVLRGIGDVLAAALGDDDRLLVVFDDAHWCDAGSAQGLKAVLESPVAARLSLLVTARDRELGRRHPVTHVLNELRRTHELTEIKLDGLDATGVSALLATRLGRAVAPRVVARLLARTGGNPFFSAELAHDLEERGALGDDAALDGAPVPDAVAGLVEERLARIDPATEEFLVAVAAIGPRADVALAAGAAGIDGSERAVVVAEAVAERLIDEEPAVAPRVVFPHALIREALLGLRTPAERARLHHAIAELLAATADPEPGALARHRELAAPVTGPGPAVSAHRLAAAASARAGAHDAAADHLEAALALMGDDPAERAPVLLALGDQRLLAADLRRGRIAYRQAAHGAAAAGDAVTMARAALGDAGGDIGFIGEMPQEDPTGPALLRDALDALGDRDPILALGLSVRRAFTLIYSDTAGELAVLARDARRIAASAGTDEAMALALVVEMVSVSGRSEDPLAHVAALPDLLPRCLDHAERSGRDDLLLRVLQMATYFAYTQADIPRVDALLTRMDELVVRLDAPRYAFEVALLRAFRHADRWEHAAAERPLSTASAALRDVRGELQVVIEGYRIITTYEPPELLHSLATGMLTGADIGLWRTMSVWSRALTGDHEGTRAELDAVLRDDFELLRRPDMHLPLSLVMCADAAVRSGHAAASALLRPPLERLRGHICSFYPAISGGLPAEFGLGLLSLLDGDHDAALRDLDSALERLDALENRIGEVWCQLSRAQALHRRGRPDDPAAARATLTTAIEQATRFGIDAVTDDIARVRAELEGRRLPERRDDRAQIRPARALQARTGRRAFAALVRDQDDETLERRFAIPRRQRALLRAMVHGYQPDHARGYHGATIVYSLEPYAIDPPSDAPWRWAIRLGERTARLLDTAPVDPDVTIEFGLADWIRVMAGLQTPLTSMSAGRCRIDGDAQLAIRQETMFTG
jgi:class 3 adenylate cyclase